MNILGNIYKTKLIQNEHNIKFWEDYLQNLNSLDFNAYSEKLTVPILVPLETKIFFRGAIKHTNEVMIALGADYFAKCSVKQAEIIRQHRIKDAKHKLLIYNKEKQYLESQLSFSNENVFVNSGQDIIEVTSEEEHKAWREKHRERVRQYNQNKEKPNVSDKDITDQKLWSRLEELELQEELENELQNIDSKTDKIEESNDSSYDSIIIKEDDVINVETGKENQTNLNSESQIIHSIPKQTSKFELLQQVLDKQNMLEEKLTEIKNKERQQSTSESDLISRLDKIEQLDELEDEMERLDDILEESDQDEDVKSESIGRSFVENKRSVSFADKEDTETLQITFKHSNNKPCAKLYSPEKGVVKPNDLYEAYSNLFTTKKTSILKKSKYNEILLHDQINNNVLETNSVKEVSSAKVSLPESDNVNRTIVINDIVEKTERNENKRESERRPVSLFKKRRQQRS